MRSQTDNRYYTARSFLACLIGLALVLATGGLRSAFAISATSLVTKLHDELTPVQSTQLITSAPEIKRDLGCQ